jgi:hypothetical protein
MKITTISKVASLVISSVMIQTAVAGHAVGIGVGPHFGRGGFGGGIFEMFFGGGGFHSARAFGGGASRSSDLQIAILLNRRLGSRRSLSHAPRPSLGRGSADPSLGGNGKSHRRVVETDSTHR